MRRPATHRRRDRSSRRRWDSPTSSTCPASAVSSSARQSDRATAALLTGKNMRETGQPGTCGVGRIVTKTLVVMGDPTVTAPRGRQRGAMLRAYDKDTGKEVGAVWMPAAQSGSPMTYSVGGKQYIVVAVAGGVYSGEYLAFSLPGGGRTPSQ